MAFPVSQSIGLTVAGANVANVTQVAINESAPTVETSDMAIATDGYRTFIPGLKDAADITINHIGGTLAIGATGTFTCGSITFTGSTIMSSEVAYRVGEVVAYTTTIRASNA
jgi:hypothetical protein